MLYHHGMTPEITVLDRLLQVSELFQRDMAHAFDGTPLTPARVRVLWELAGSGPCTQQTLAGRMQVSPRNITGLVDALQAGGYVSRSPHPTDRRATIVALEPSAEEFMRTMQGEHTALTADLLGAVAEADRAALSRGLDAIAVRLTELVAADEARRAGERSGAS